MKICTDLYKLRKEAATKDNPKAYWEEVAIYAAQKWKENNAKQSRRAYAAKYAWARVYYEAREQGKRYENIHG